MKISCCLVYFIVVSLFIVCAGSSLRAQVRITEVTISDRSVEVTNFGTSSVNLAGWFFCHRFIYPGLSGTIAPGQSRVFTVNFNQTSSDLCLYSSSNFTNPADLQDFLQWGASFAVNGRESVATHSTRQIWTAGFFFAVPPTGKSLHANGVTSNTGTRTANWFPGWPHTGFFPVPNMEIESLALTGGEWRITAKSYYLTNAHRVDLSGDLSGAWQQLAAPTITELGAGRIDVRFPATGTRQFSRLRAQ